MMAQNVAVKHSLFSYQTSKNHTRFINIHIKLSKEQERKRIHFFRNNYMCVRVYLIELKTHARSENTKFLLFFFNVSYETTETKEIFSSGKYTHTYLHLRAEKKKIKIHRTRKRQSRLETNKNE
jgi:hypothetical protein